MRVTEHTDPWIKALRSGKYDQGAGYLNAYGMFCCLGVGIDVMGCEWVADDEASPAVLLPTNNDEYCSALSEERRNQLGISESEMVELYSANDSMGKTFAEIADAIEAAKTSGEIKF